MGEIADMMIEGDMCQVCGEWLGEGDGFPRTCRGCAGDADEIDHDKLLRAKVRCPTCGKRCKGHQGYLDHWRAKHDGPPS